MFGLDQEFLCRTALVTSVQAMDELISQFLHEVNDHHFPVFTDYWSDDETLQHPALQGNIPVRPKGFNHWYVDDPITLFMALAGLEEDPHPALDLLETDYPQFDIPWGFRLSDLPTILDRMDLAEHLAALPDLIRMVTRRTGYFFLDQSAEEYDFYQDRGAGIYWDAENVSWLKADWAQAKPIISRVWQLIDWVMEDREERTTVLMDRVLEAHEVMGANDYQVVFDELEKANQTIKELSHSIDVKIDKLMCKDRRIEKYQKIKKVLFLLLEAEKKTEQLKKVTNDDLVYDYRLSLRTAILRVQGWATKLHISISGTVLTPEL